MKNQTLNEGGNCGCVTNESSKKPSSSLREDHNEKIRSTYLNDLKMALDKSSFNSFFSALSAYKKTDNYDAMVSVVAALTTEKPEHFHLLQSKYQPTFFFFSAVLGVKLSTS
ncbi:hypothetical protein JD844_019211 [Phrynosoma platyrhinos]|uniref:Uncharacterized protein n=1 Tax=Phrynosoma platyrhinos TaxID=52577 RepID=A0ABQ7SPJ4_PHRPL|nr:hypothetical protein JD844_019211 [Phrynosoma platyrhinos]